MARQHQQWNPGRALGVVAVATAVVGVVVSLPARSNETGNGAPAPVGNAAVQAFAREHHPELAALLEQLETADPAAFAAASAEIGRTLERLERLRERQPELHEAKLQDWKLSSRIRLALARMALTKDPDPQLDEELRELVRQRQTWQRVAYAAEREKIVKRLERIDEILEEQARDPAVAVDREAVELIRRATKRK
jgi:alkylhydroperoxidase family enzyme